jgi:class 3 adenylate cyclase
MSSAAVPSVRYARGGEGVALAYQVVGQGSVDVVYVPPWVSNLEVIWENPLYARFLSRLAAFARLIVVDPRGMGLSDRFAPADAPPMEVLMEDIGVVMESASVERAVLFGSGNSGCLSALFAATHPDRTLALIVYGAEARGRQAPDYPWAWSDDEWDRYLAGIASGWGTSEYVDEVIGWITPSLAADVAQRRWWGRLQRLSASPNSVAAVEKIWREIDVRPILPAIQAATLVLHRTGDPVENVEAGRDFAGGIPGAKFIEVPGDDWPAWAGDQSLIVDHVEAFVHGIQREAARLDRVLTTVMFTDIVGSTERATAIGDERWHLLLDAHNAKVRALVSRYRGTERGNTGDGFLATFDGPARAVLCARAIAEAMDPIDLQIRAGVHTGECHITGNQLTGIAVHIGARVAALAGPGRVLVSGTVKDLVAGSGIEFVDHGVHTLKGVDGDWPLYEVAAS